MKSVKKAAAVLLTAVMICMTLVTVAFAAENEAVWLSVTETSTQKGTAAQIVTNTTVTDGVVKLTYDSTALTYTGIETNDSYVAMYSVNAEEAGVVLISWVAPEAYETDGSAIWLIQVNFTGTEDVSSMILTGTANDAKGNKVALADAPDATELEKAIEKAEAVDQSVYTEESYAALTDALEAAKAVLADPTATQAELDAAAAELLAAIDALAKVTGPSINTGDSAMLGLAVCAAAVCVCGVAVLTVNNKKWRAAG